jgi:choline-glycine betaine transporter
VENGWLFILMLFVLLMTFFGTVAMSVGVMCLGEYSDNSEYRDERQDRN